MRILNRQQVCELLGISSVTLWRMTRDGTFPKPIDISTRRKGWPEALVRQWISDKVAAANPSVA